MPLFGPPNVERLKAKGNVKGLIKALGYQKDSRVREDAALALGQIGDPRAVEPLIAALNDEDKGVRAVAGGALGRIGEPAVKPLIAALEDKDANVRQAAAETLGRIGEPAVEPLIATPKHWRDWSESRRQTVVRALGQIGGTRAVSALIAALKAGHIGVRGPAIEALAGIGTPAVAQLIIALEDESQGVASAVAEALGKIGDVRAVEPLISVLKNRPGYVSDVAAGALGEIGDARAVEPLILVLKNRPGLVRLVAAKVLGEIGDVRAVEPLITTLRDGNHRERWTAARALGKIGDSRAVKPLVASLKDLHEGVRIAAAEALDRFGWQPDKSEVGAAYWPAIVAHWLRMRQYDKCVEAGTPAVEPLTATLFRGGKDERRRAAEALVALYRGGELDEQSKQRILALRKTMARPHGDYSPPNDCHDDVGIGVTF